MISSGDTESSLPERLRFDDTMMWVEFRGGRVLGIPLRWYPRLLNATPEQRMRYEISDLMPGLYWDEIDEDITVPGLLAGRRDQTRLGRAQVEAEDRAIAEAALQAAE